MKPFCAALCLFLAACSDAEPLATVPSPSARLGALDLDGDALNPRFSPEITAYGADVGLLAQHVRLRGALRDGAAELRVTGRDGAPLAVEQDENGAFSVLAPLALGDNALELSLGSEHYAVSVTRHAEPWSDVTVLGLEPPVENAYFGDYLRVSERFLYVNAERRGRLYEKRDGAWTFAQPSEDLLPVPLEWMYEAAITDDALAFVAQPAGGTETLFAFTLDDGGHFVPAGEHETNDQGTLRLRGDELVFAGAEKLDVLRRVNGAWSLAQTLAAPAPDIGFALRPTYSDAPGVALGDGVLVVGAPLASRPTSPGADPTALGCRPEEACALESGAVLVYERNEQGVYGAPAVLVPKVPSTDLHFGHATALDGEWLAVGVPRESTTATESGAVFLFRREATGWLLTSELRQSAARPYDYFGDELVLAGDVLLAGAPGQDGAFGASASDASALDSGGVFAFLREDGSFRELGLHQLSPEVAPPFPFPKALQRAGRTLAAASNTAPVTGGDGRVVENAGRAFVMR